MLDCVGGAGTKRLAGGIAHDDAAVSEEHTGACERDLEQECSCEVSKVPGRLESGFSHTSASMRRRMAWLQMPARCNLGA